MTLRFRSAAWCVVSLVVVASGAAWADPVKMSRSAICHCPGGAYYARTRHFTSYEAIEICLQSGGRHPKQGQGNCQAGAGDLRMTLLSPIAGEDAQPYDRAAFGGWEDTSGNCRDTRH